MIKSKVSFGYLLNVGFNAFFTVFRDKPSFFAIFLVPILGFRFFKFRIVIQSSIEITSKPPAINQEYFSNLGGSIFDGKSGSILSGNLHLRSDMTRPHHEFEGAAQEIAKIK